MSSVRLLLASATGFRQLANLVLPVKGHARTAQGSSVKVPMSIPAPCSLQQQRMWTGANMSERKCPGRDKNPCGLSASEVSLNGKQKARLLFGYFHISRIAISVSQQLG